MLIQTITFIFNTYLTTIFRFIRLTTLGHSMCIKRASQNGEIIIKYENKEFVTIQSTLLCTNPECIL